MSPLRRQCTMSRRFLDRAFSQAQFRDKQPNRRQYRKAKSRPPHQKASEVDVIERIIKASELKDFLSVLGMPLPNVDELGNPVWDYSPNDITKSYRQLCLLVHPDKNSGERARHAFQLLNKAYKMMLDEGKRNEILKASCGVALAEEEKREARATVDEKIKINAKKIQQKRKLTKIQHENFSSEILRQTKDRQMSSSMKKRKIATSRYTEKKTEQEEADGIPQDEDLSMEKDAKEIDHSAAVMMHPSHYRANQASEKERVRAKLKSTEKPPEEEWVDAVTEDSEEWTAAVMNKSKQQHRRKPRFMF